MVENIYLIRNGEVLTTFAVYGGLHHIIFLFWFLVLVVFCLMFCWYCISCLYPAFFSASFYGLTGFLSISSFANNYELFRINNLYFNIFYLYYLYFIYVSYMFYIVLKKCSTNKEIFRNSVKPYKKESRV